MTLQVIQSGVPRTAILSGKSLGSSLNTKSITTSYTVQPTDDVLICNATAGNIVIQLNFKTLPDKILYITKVDNSTNTIRIYDTVNATIDHVGNYYLMKYLDSVILVNREGYWHIYSLKELSRITRYIDASNNINFYERTNNELALRFSRQAANKYKVSLPRIGSVMSNVCEKIALPTPTVSGWTTNPAPLSEIIDDDYEDLPTIGVVAANGIGIVLFDLGEPYSLSIGVFQQKEGGTMQVQLSLDNVIFVTCPPNNTDPEAIIQSANGVGRYIRAMLFAGAAERRLYSLGVSAIGAPIT